MQKEILAELEKLNDEIEFVLNNKEEIENKHIENFLRNLERTRYNIFNKIKLQDKYVIDELEKIDYLNKNYKAIVENEVLKINIDQNEAQPPRKTYAGK